MFLCFAAVLRCAAVMCCAVLCCARPYQQGWRQQRVVRDPVLIKQKVSTNTCCAGYCGFLRGFAGSQQCLISTYVSEMHQSLLVARGLFDNQKECHLQPTS